jgi:hypothetical protein
MNYQTEYQVVMASDPLNRYRYFLNVVIDTAVVWVARSSEGGLLTFDLDGLRVMPVFAREVFGGGWAKQRFENTIESVPLDLFVEEHVSSGELFGASIGVMPTVEDWGYVVDIPRFVRDVRMELDLIT